MSEPKELRKDDGGRITPAESFGNTVVELSGLTKHSRMILNNRPLVILYFPFRIGRLSRVDSASSAKQDLLLPDSQPYFVSRNHLVIARENGTIVLVDETSACGTFVDGTRIGSNTGVAGRMELRPGQHTIAIGGPDSPYLFEAKVRATSTADYLSLDGDIPDRLPQARLLYAKLCQYERKLLAGRNLTPQQRGKAAGEMARAIVKRQDLLELLRCLASNPTAAGDYLAQHSVNVAIFSAVLFTGLGHAPEEIVRIAAGALLHDIGMQGVDRDILLKTGPLSPAEYESVKKHTDVGGELLSSPDDICSVAASMARDHHRRIDGSGYPRAEGPLPDVTRFLGLIDSFEAVTHDRPQRQAFTPHEAVNMLVAAKDAAFDADTRRAFLNAFSFFPVSSIVRLSTGETGQVVGVNEGRPLAPRVRVLLDPDGRPHAAPRLLDLCREPGVSIVKNVADRGFARHYSAAAPVGPI